MVQSVRATIYMMTMMMMDERSKGTCFPSAEAAYLRSCFTYNHQAMSIYHQCHHQHSCSRAIQPDSKDTMIPPGQSAVPCRHLHDAVGACPQVGSCVVGLPFNWRRHALSLPKFTSSPHNALPTDCEESIMLSAQRFFFFVVVVIPRICRPQIEHVCLHAGLGTILSSPVQTLTTSLFIVVLTLSLSLYRRLSAHNLDLTLLATRQVSIGPAVQ